MFLGEVESPLFGKIHQNHIIMFTSKAYNVRYFISMYLKGGGERIFDIILDG